MPVVDASVLVEYLANGEHAESAQRRMLEEHGSLWAPHLIDAEVGHALRRGVRLGELAADAARSALGDLVVLPMRRVAHRSLLDRAWELRDKVSFYDGLYIALAETLGESLITFDRRLGKVQDAGVQIEVLSQA